MSFYRQLLHYKISDTTLNDARSKVEIERDRLELRDTIERWWEEQSIFMPDVISKVASQVGPEPEFDILYLPSQLPDQYKLCTWFPLLAAIEKELRQGDAADTLDKLREALQLEELLLVGKTKLAVGNKSVTRSLNYVHKASGRASLYRDQYNRCREAMIILGMKPDDPGFPEVKDSDIRLKVLTGWKATGDGKRTDSWIWTHGAIGNLEDWQDDSTSVFLPLVIPYLRRQQAYRVQYFRAKLDRTQWREEVEILESEMSRIFKWFARLCHTWQLLAAKSTSDAFSAYAHQTADVYARRAVQCREDAFRADQSSLKYWAHTGNQTFMALESEYDIEPQVMINSFLFTPLTLFVGRTLSTKQLQEELAEKQTSFLRVRSLHN